MGNNLRMEKQQQIQVLTGLGWTDRAISRSTGINRGTVSKYRKAFQKQPEVPADLPPFPITNSTQNQPYTGKIRDGLLQKLTAQRIYQDFVEEHGYKGSYDAVKRYARKLRKKVRGFSDRLEHIPGKEAQVDFGKATCRILYWRKMEKSQVVDFF